MATTQTQIRRGTATQCNLLTPADGEIIYDQTADRLRIGDGAIVGGIPLPNISDIQGGKILTGNDSGTTNHIVVSLSPDPGAPSAGSTCVVKIANTNTGAVDLNLNGHGAVGAVKVTSAGLAAFTGGELVAGAYYPFWHNGTNWQQGNGGGGSVSSITSSIGNISVSIASGVADINLNTNNAGGVGTIINASPGSAVGNGGTIAGTSLYLISAGTGVNGRPGATNVSLPGTWRNITGVTIPAPQNIGGGLNFTFGSFQRIS